MHNSKNLKLLILFILAVISLIVIYSFPAIAQDPKYHHFANSRTFFHIPNAWDVFSNLAFIGVGVYGCYIVLTTYLCITKYEASLWLLLFTCVILVGFTSAFYHLAPTNRRLALERLFMATAFMTFLSILFVERAGYKLGTILSPIFILCGIASVILWIIGELHGRGDLRLYAFIQFFPWLALPYFLIFFPSPENKSIYLIWTFVFIILSKAFELYDDLIFSLTRHIISGHTLKHLASAVGIYFLVLYVKAKRLSRRDVLRS